MAVPQFMDPEGPQILLTLDDFEALAANNKVSIPNVPVYSTEQMQTYRCRQSDLEPASSDRLMTVAVNKMTLRSDSAIVDAAIVSPPPYRGQSNYTDWGLSRDRCDDRRSAGRTDYRQRS